MKTITFLPTILTFVIVISCQSRPETSNVNATPATPQINLEKIGKKIISQADLQAGEKVLLVMAPGEFNAMIPILIKAISQHGASYLGTISVTDDQPDSWSTSFTTKAAGKGLAELEAMFREVDLGIMLPGASPVHPPYKALQNILEEDGIRRTIHFHWAGAYDLNGNLLETSLGKSLFYEEVILNTDYAALARHQDEFDNEMRDETIRVTTPAGTDIRFEIGDRPVTKQDGNASAARAQIGKNLIDREIEIPSGAIRVAPIEKSVNGTIAFPDADWDGARVNDLIVTIKEGLIIDIAATSGQDAVEREIKKAGNAGKSFREFALGFNPLMTIQTDPSPWIPYYGYGAGVVRLSLGDNTELGGIVGGGYVRWNFFTDATVSVGEDQWVVDGTLIK